MSFYIYNEDDFRATDVLKAKKKCKKYDIYCNIYHRKNILFVAKNVIYVLKNDKRV